MPDVGNLGWRRDARAFSTKIAHAPHYTDLFLSVVYRFLFNSPYFLSSVCHSWNLRRSPARPLPPGAGVTSNSTQLHAPGGF